MIELTREVLAYGMISGVLLLAAPWVTLRRRQRRKLRQRGIKRYGH